MKLTDILTALRQWLSHVDCPVQVLTDSSDGLRVIFETENALAELLAGEGAFSPYRFVAFTVLDPRQELHAEPVFCFYDDASHTIGDILRELDRGLRFLAAK